ncbi:hypothetical protein B566_EDAN003815 [Ephemera danica]|nr:hypothetical protein B566_EDAN003815 [Ephemera danica]
MASASMEDIRKLKDIQQRHLAWFESGYLADCEFKIGTETIKCHRLILSLESAVFDAGFNGPLAPAGDMVVTTIVDVSARHFKAFIQFLYTDTISFRDDDLDMVVALCFCAEKNHMDVTKCLEIYQNMELLTVKELEWKIHDILQEETIPVLQNGILTDISVNTLIRVLNLKYLAVDEYTLIKHCLEWALVTQQLPVENEDDEIRSLREVVAPLRPYFRFRALTLKEFQLLYNNFDFLAEDIIKKIKVCLENHAMEMPIGFSNDSQQRVAPVENVIIQNNLRGGQVCEIFEHSYDLWELFFALEVGAATVHGVMVRGSRFGQQNKPAQLERFNIEVRNRSKGHTVANINFEGMVTHGENVLVNFDRPFVIKANEVYSINVNYFNQKISYESSNSTINVTMTHPTITLRPFYPKFTHISEILISQNFKRQQ